MDMATKKRRLNITLTPEMEEFISILAKRDKVPEATKVSQILEEALEEMEDQIWLEIAEEREAERGPYVSHEELWASVFKSKGIKASFNNYCNIRKAIPIEDAPILFNELIETMNVDFVKHEGLTVLPFPFKYIREYLKIHNLLN